MKANQVMSAINLNKVIREARAIAQCDNTKQISPLKIGSEQIDLVILKTAWQAVEKALSMVTPTKGWVVDGDRLSYTPLPLEPMYLKAHSSFLCVKPNTGKVGVSEKVMGDHGSITYTIKSVEQVGVSEKVTGGYGVSDKWISMKDRTPTTSGTYAVICYVIDGDDFMGVLGYDINLCWLASSDKVITHWFPLPTKGDI